MEELSDLQQIRKRPAMYVGSTGQSGLLQVFCELLDNSIDQFLSGTVTSISVSTDGKALEFSDDGPGLPFDRSNDRSGSLASYYLTEIRRSSPTADGHTPHIHTRGFGCGLRIVSALTESCVVTSCRNGKLWRQEFNQGVPREAAKVVSECSTSGTTFRLTVDREVFSGDWCARTIDKRLQHVAYLFPGLRVQSPRLQTVAINGIADWAVVLANEVGAVDAEKVWWFNESTDNMILQAAVAGTIADQPDANRQTQWHAFANGNRSTEFGTHLAALKQVIKACRIKPAVGLIHVVMNNPQFAGPTRSKLVAPEILSPICQALKPSLQRYIASPGE